MKEPDIKAIRNKLGIPADNKFIGYVIFDSRQGDFLLDYAASTEMFSFKRFTSTPQFAKKFTRYYKVLRVIKSLEMEERAIIMMAFDLGSQIGVIDMPSCSEMIN
ncbi:hypothetical protein GT147_002404 [Salmonella enterica]|nr:hypothetical protein [Salmonella enterica subsp. enterica serovar Infantis]EDW6857289.1 hypothetical protein [Salmonella enterica]EEJ5736436.1 hypothetical protein [Salmonella enterica]EIY0670745.1 hypothetical protein [Salmonella enterica]